mgnify:CR=1 FL=1
MSKNELKIENDGVAQILIYIDAKLSLKEIIPLSIGRIKLGL